MPRPCMCYSIAGHRLPLFLFAARFLALAFRAFLELALYVDEIDENTFWPAPGLDDTQLSESSSSLELHRA